MAGDQKILNLLSEVRVSATPRTMVTVMGVVVPLLSGAGPATGRSRMAQPRESVTSTMVQEVTVCCRLGM
jgi:hypothetical protein